MVVQTLKYKLAIMFVTFYVWMQHWICYHFHIMDSMSCISLKCKREENNITNLFILTKPKQENDVNMGWSDVWSEQYVSSRDNFLKCPINFFQNTFLRWDFINVLCNSSQVDPVILSTSWLPVYFRNLKADIKIDSVIHHLRLSWLV